MSSADAIRPPEGPVAPPVQKAPPWNEFSLQVDENIGPYFGAPRKTAAGDEYGWFGTNNFTLKLVVQPKALLGKYAGLLFNIGDWIRTADFDPTSSKSVMRLFAAPIGYVRFFENENHRVQLVDSPTYFYGFDLNDDPKKHWESQEFGNYAALSYTHKPSQFTIDVHNWYVKGLEVMLAGGVHAGEDGVIIGTTASWVPFAKSGIPVLKSFEPYARFREWGWIVEPEGKHVGRQWWSELTFGFKMAYDFSLFE